jgi:hypothetical protein
MLIKREPSEQGPSGQSVETKRHVADWSGEWDLTADTVLQARGARLPQLSPCCTAPHLCVHTHLHDMSAEWEVLVLQTC